MKIAKAKNFYFRSSLFVILSLVGAAFNYALYPILVRILNTANFGDFAAIIAISNQILGLLLAFNIILIYLVKSQGEDKAKAHAEVIQKSLIWLLLLMTVVMLAFSPFLHNLLHIKNLSSFLLLSIILLAAIPAVVWIGYLQGHKEMVRIGVFNVGASLAKLILSVGLAMAFGTTGAIAGILGGTAVGLLILAIYPGVKLPSIKTVFQKSQPTEKSYLLSLGRYMLSCVFVVGALSFLQNYDITLAKALFPPDMAGVYSGVSILSNALYYVSFLVIWIIMPEIQINNRAVNRRVLGTAYKLLSALAIVSIGGEFLAKNFITKVLLGPDFASQGKILIFASLYQLTLVAITLYAFYLLVQRKRRSILLAGLVFGLALFLPAYLTSSLTSMIVILWISLLLAIILYGLIITIYTGFSRSSGDWA